VKRRAFITLLGGAAVAWPFAGRAQQGDRIRRVGVLMNGPATNAESQSHLATFVHGLRQLGWVEGQNLRVDIRWNAGDATLARTYAAQLIGLMPDVILAATTVNLEVVRQATSTVPVVFVQVSDPVAQGFVASLPKPGGNLTGFAGTEFSVGGKWLDLLKEIAPGLAHVAIMFNPDTAPQAKFFVRSIEAAASSLRVQPVVVPVRAMSDIESAFESFTRALTGGLILTTDPFTNLRQQLIAELASRHLGGLILTTDPFTNLRQQLIAELASRHRLPAISWVPDFPKNGGLMSYGATINFLGQFRQAAGYVDRILKGEKPADLPVQAPTKYELAIHACSDRRVDPDDRSLHQFDRSRRSRSSRRCRWSAS
jgi:putative ABC transport system substrate-binding protein